MRQVARAHLENLLAEHRGDSGISGDDGAQVGEGSGEVLQHLGLCTGISGTTFIVGRVSRHKLNDKSREDLEALPATTLISNTEPGLLRGAPHKS